MSLQAPFPWFGGKRKVAAQVWAALGDVSHYVEPFFGSGAVLLNRPAFTGIETVNDADGLLANFWRAVSADPAGVATEADYPCNEADLHARHLWLVGARDDLTARLMADHGFHDVRAAGWWVWGACNWIGSGWCSGQGPWIAQDGELIDSRQLPHLSGGQGINRKLPHLGDSGRDDFIARWFGDLAARLRGVRVACGDWSRVTGPSVLRAGGGLTGIFLDPPYSSEEHSIDYAAGQVDVGHEVLAWCKEQGSDPAQRIVLAGYAGEHDELVALGWRVAEWKAGGGYGSQGECRGRENAARERMWFSPHCVETQRGLFDAAPE